MALRGSWQYRLAVLLNEAVEVGESSTAKLGTFGDIEGTWGDIGGDCDLEAAFGDRGGVSTTDDGAGVEYAENFSQALLSSETDGVTVIEYPESSMRRRRSSGNVDAGEGRRLTGPARLCVPDPLGRDRRGLDTGPAAIR